MTGVAPVLAAESLPMAKHKPPDDMQAYDCLLKGQDLLAAARTSQELREARALCHTLRTDSTLARAFAFRSLSNNNEQALLGHFEAVHWVVKTL
ncbi:MAG TPA: hypothetical protein VGJ75_26605 [Dongiaceae bacterium]